jgi:quercetin dioxygenase-like cupin family protein
MAQWHRVSPTSRRHARRSLVAIMRASIARMPPHKGQPDVREGLFGGRGAVRVWDLLADHAKSPAPFTAVLSCELDPGGSVGRHVQEQFPELVIGLEGAGEAAVDGRPQPLDAGDVVHLPLGSVLALRNRSDTEPLRYLIIKARA